MSQQNLPIRPQGSLLPWAQDIWGETTSGAGTAVAASENVTPSGGDAPWLATDASAPKTNASVQPWVNGAPFRPEPTIPQEDRRDRTRDALVSIAEALDIISTHTRRLPRDETVLHHFVAALVVVAKCHGFDQTSLEELLDHAAGASGQARGTLLRHIASLPLQTPNDGHSDAQSVGAALSRLEEAARLVVGEARLLLDNRLDKSMRGR